MSHQTLQEGSRIFSCDGCSSAEEFDKLDFEQAKATILKHGWKIVKSPIGEWKHFCEVCVEEGKHAKAGKVQTPKIPPGSWRKKGRSV